MKPKLIYVPVDVKQEMPVKESTDYFLINKNGELSIGIKPYNVPFFTELTNEKFLENKETHWLKPVEAYTFTEQELKELLEKTFNAGHTIWNFEKGGAQKDKQEYINSILNK